MGDRHDWEELMAERNEQDKRIAELEREVAELRETLLLIGEENTLLVGIDPSRLRELERCRRRWETCERLAEIQESLDGMVDIWVVQIVRRNENTFADAIDGEGV